MSRMVKVKNPKTGVIDIVSVQNASDYQQHLGWEFVGVVEVADGKPFDAMEPQAVIDNSKNVANLSGGDSDEKEVKVPVETMTAAEVKAAQKAAKAAAKE